MHSILACYADAPYAKIDPVAACNMQRNNKYSGNGRGSIRIAVAARVPLTFVE